MITVIRLAEGLWALDHGNPKMPLGSTEEAERRWKAEKLESRDVAGSLNRYKMGQRAMCLKMSPFVPFSTLNLYFLITPPMHSPLNSSTGVNVCTSVHEEALGIHFPTDLMQNNIQMTCSCTFLRMREVKSKQSFTRNGGGIFFDTVLQDQT